MFGLNLAGVSASSFNEQIKKKNFYQQGKYRTVRTWQYHVRTVQEPTAREDDVSHSRNGKSNLTKSKQSMEEQRHDEKITAEQNKFESDTEDRTEAAGSFLFLKASTNCSWSHKTQCCRKEKPFLLWPLPLPPSGLGLHVPVYLYLPSPVFTGRRCSKSTMCPLEQHLPV
jgi:hypothetical protein